MKTVEISVTAEDIANGDACDCSRCPVALAIRRAIPSNAEVQVHYELVTYYDAAPLVRDESDEYLHANLPEIAQGFIARFDTDVNGPLVQPFTFQLEVPEVMA